MKKNKPFRLGPSYSWRVRYSSAKRGAIQTFVTEPTQNDALRAGLAKLGVRRTKENVERTQVECPDLTSEQTRPQMDLISPQEMRLKKGA